MPANRGSNTRQQGLEPWLALEDSVRERILTSLRKIASDQVEKLCKRTPATSFRLTQDPLIEVYFVTTEPNALALTVRFVFDVRLHVPPPEEYSLHYIYSAFALFRTAASGVPALPPALHDVTEATRELIEDSESSYDWDQALHKVRSNCEEKEGATRRVSED